MTTTFSIYVLKDEHGATRYVGKTTDPKKRLTRHLSPCYLKDATHKNRWINGMLSRGIRPTMDILASIDDEAIQIAMEIEFIALYRFLGFRLTNATDGGDGASSGASNPMFGIPRPQHVKDAVSRANKGKSRGRILRPTDIPTIRELLADGVSQTAIARAFNVCRQLIWGIAHGQNWKGH